MFVVQPIRRRRHGRSDGGAVFDQADPHALEILQEPIVIQRHRADDVGPAGERDDADAIVRPAFDELSRDFADGIDSRRLFPADREIFCQHRSGNIEHEHDVDPAGLDLGETFAQLRPRQRDDKNCQSCEQQRAQNFAGARRALLSDGSGVRCRRKMSAAAAPRFPRK